MENFFVQGDFGVSPLDVRGLLLGLCISFLGGHAISWVYMLTHSGLSYSRSFVNSLVVMPIVVCLVMQVMFNNLVTALGLMAVFAVVRFRNILRDTFDSTYILSVLVLGMAAGTKKYSTATLGVLVICAVLLYLSYSNFGVRHKYDFILNLHWARADSDLTELGSLLSRHSKKAKIASQRSHEGYEGTDLSYRLLLRNPARIGDLLTEVRNLNGVTRVTSLRAEDESEI
ncbi:MAG: putative rane protein [Verrucomicrobiales bacterium]|nr:putative rane protein [Verrucomicrobiales bacterium]